MAKKKSELSATQKIGIGVGLTAAAVSAAGAYFLYGSKDAKQNRATVKSWALKAKAEVLEALEDAKEMSKEDYEVLVDTVSAAYASAKKASRSDLSSFRKEMKDHWNRIEKEAGTVKKVASKVAKKTAKKVSKAVSKKAPKKAAKKAAPKAAKKAPKKVSKKK